jgi:hypothetical protein
LYNVSAGVPQGSVLGHLLFLVYINDIGEQLLSLTRLFADDTTLGYSSSSPDALELVINHDLNKLSTWSGQWLMSFNPDKTEIMICSNMEIPNNLNFSFNGKLISNTSSHKHLGVPLSHDAKWSEHVENIAKTISKHLGVSRKFKFKMNRQKCIWFMYVLSLNMRVKFGTTVVRAIQTN